MEITERDLEDLIFDAFTDGDDDLLLRGFNPNLAHYCDTKVYWYRQVNLGAYGIADIIGVSRSCGKIWVDIIELKNRPIKTEDFDQVFRYEAGVNQLIKSTFKNPVRTRISCYLVGPSIESGHFIHNNSGLNIFTFTYTIRGFRFNRLTPGWIRTDSRNLSIKTVSFSSQVIVHPKPTETNG